MTLLVGLPWTPDRGEGGESQMRDKSAGLRKANSIASLSVHQAGSNRNRWMLDTMAMWPKGKSACNEGNMS